MLVIVEGIDRVGKTTLCKMLENEGFNVYKNKGIIDVNDMSNREETDKMLKLLDLYSLTKGDLVFDRFHMSDFVYGCIERSYNEGLAKMYVSMIEERLLKLNAVIILVNPTDISMSSSEHGGDLLEHQKLFRKIYRSSAIKNKFQCTYNTLKEAEIFIKSIRNKEM